jgi:hypothetical protein
LKTGQNVHAGVRIEVAGPADIAAVEKLAAIQPAN